MANSLPAEYDLDTYFDSGKKPAKQKAEVSEKPKSVVDQQPINDNSAAWLKSNNVDDMFDNLTSPQTSDDLPYALGAVPSTIAGYKLGKIIENRASPSPEVIDPEPGRTTPGQRWLKNWANISTDNPDIQGVPEAAQKYNKTKPYGNISSKLYKKFGELKPGRLAGNVAQEILEEAPSLIGTVSKPLQGALGGLGAGFGAIDTYNRMQQGDQTGAVISGIGTAASLAAPFVGGAVLGPAAVAAPLANMAVDYTKKLKQQRLTDPTAQGGLPDDMMLTGP